jgi:hypothetical protein
MTTRTRIPSRTRTESRIELDPAEFEAFGLESGERAAAGGLPAGPGRELSPGLIDEAADRARVRATIGVGANRSRWAPMRCPQGGVDVRGAREGLPVGRSEPVLSREHLSLFA